MVQILGIDFGGVICDRVGSDGTMITDFIGDECHRVPEISGAIEAIRQLLLEKFWSEHMFIISSAMAASTEINSRYWIQRNEFCEQSGFRNSHIFFCRGREIKAEIC